MPKSKPQQTRLRITACSSAYSGEHPNGHKYTLYDIEACKPDGTPVQENLRSFEELPVDEVLDLNVVRFPEKGENEYGVSYTLSRRGGSGNTQKIKLLEERIARMEAALGMEAADEASLDPAH